MYTQVVVYIGHHTKRGQNFVMKCEEGRRFFFRNMTSHNKWAWSVSFKNNVCAKKILWPASSVHFFPQDKNSFIDDLYYYYLSWNIGIVITFNWMKLCLCFFVDTIIYYICTQKFIILFCVSFYEICIHISNRGTKTKVA